MYERKYYIYEIYNDITQKRYIGMTGHIKDRIRMHLKTLENYEHSSREMIKDRIKYGLDHFSFRILEIVYNRRKGFQREYYYMRKYNTYVDELGYNGHDPRFTTSARRSKAVRERKRKAKQEEVHE